MPAHYDIDGHLIQLRLEGAYTTDDMREAVLKIVGDPQRPAKPQFLLDLTASTSLEDRSADDVKLMAAFLSKHAEPLGGQAAILVRGGLAHGLMRMGAVYAEQDNLPTRVFHELGEALSWLNDPDSVEP